jgi:hypothetical protein
MRSFASRLIDAARGGIMIITLGLGTAVAADIPPLPGPQPPGYYGSPRADEGYLYPPPAAYAYPAPPRYYYAPPPVAVMPGPYYPRYYGGVWGYAPYRGYGYRGRRR